MELPEVLAVIGITMLAGWFLAKLVGKRGGGKSEEDTAVPSARLWMLVQGDNGPEFVPCYYDGNHHGYNVRDSFFPREFCRTVGHGVVVLATHMLMPADGDSKHPGSHEELVSVPQPSFTASWTDYDRARRRLNWDAVWSRGDGSLSGLKNIANGLMVVCLLLGVFMLFGLRGQVARLSDSSVVLAGQLSRISGDTLPATLPAPAPVAVPGPIVDLGRPTGDR